MMLSEFILHYQGHWVDKYGNFTSYIQEQQPFGGQCVSLVKHYLTTFGKGYTKDSYGNAKDYIKLPNAKLITKDKVQDGDLVVWTGGSFGHIGIMYGGAVFSQNPMKAQLRTIEAFKSWGLGEPTFIRPSLQTLQPKLGYYKTLDYLNIRKGPDQSYKIKKVYEITADAKKKVTSKNTSHDAVLKPNQIVSVLEIKGGWGRIPSGWVNLKYLKEM